MNILERDDSILKEYKKLVLASPYFSRDSTDRLKEFSQESGIPTLIAEDEAENLACSLAVERKVSAVWSSDTDTYPLGAPIVVKGFEIINREINIKGVFTLNILKSLQLDHDSFRDFCILLGTDFNDRIDRIGPVSSLALIKKYKNIETITKETKHNTYCLHEKEVRKQLTPYSTDNIGEERLNTKFTNIPSPFKDEKYNTIFSDFIANTRDIGEATKMPKITIKRK